MEKWVLMKRGARAESPIAVRISAISVGRLHSATNTPGQTCPMSCSFVITAGRADSSATSRSKAFGDRCCSFPSRTN